MTESLIKQLAEYGSIGVVLGLCLLYIWILKKEDVKSKLETNERLKQLEKINQDNFNLQISINKESIEKQSSAMEMFAKSNQNVAEALVCLKITLDNTVAILKEYGITLRNHDERAIEIKEGVFEIKEKVANCSKRK